MTTIAYKDGVIAFDSIETAGDTVTDNNANKLKKVDGVSFVFSGPVCDQDDLISAYFSRQYSPDCRATAFIIDDGRVWLAGVDESDGFWKFSVDKPHAIGSGMLAAYGAMDFGADAIQAVRIACGRDVYSGGRVRKIRV